MSKIVKLSDRTHVLKRPARYIGSIVPVEVERYYLKDDKIIFGTIKYVPALLKIIREILDNSIDNAIVHNFKISNQISIKMDDKKISVEDNGTGIPIKYIQDEHGNIIEKYAPEAVWTELKTGSNFEDAHDNKSIGMNGEGSTLTNIFSTKFIGETDDGVHYFRLECKDNMDPEKIKTKIEKSKGQTGTKVTFYPDLEKLHLGNEIPELYQDLLKFELLYLAITYPEITFKFNGRIIKTKTTKQLYNQYFDDAIILEETDDVIIGISPSDDGYRFIHFINGLNVFNGGKILDYTEDKIIGALTERIKKRVKDIKKNDVKNKITFHCILKNIPNPRFADQIKSESVNLPSQFPEQANQIQEIAKSRFIDRVYKTKEISGPIIDLFKAKQMIKDKKDLEKTIKRIKPPAKYWAATKEKKYFVISEGDSAITSIINGVGRESYGYFPIKGKIVNVFKNPKKLKSNTELLEIAKLLNIDLNKDQQNITYENIVLATDADVDGNSIVALFLAYFFIVAPDLLKAGKIYRFLTPIVVLYKGDEIYKFIFDFNELKQFEEENKKKPIKNLIYDYKKGLGSLSEEEWDELFKRHSFEDLLMQLKIKDYKDIEALEKWMNEDTEYRKEMIINNLSLFDINQI